MQSQKLVSFFFYLFYFGKNAVAKARVIFCIYFGKNAVANARIIFMFYLY
jgi:hypothetical protein